LPAGATLGTCKVCVATPGASADWAIDISKQTPNFSTGVFGSPAAVGTGSSGTVTSGSTPDVATANGGGATIAGDSSYWITIGCPNTSANDLQISGVEVSFVDPGPRNY
jgi:hypothetical protein